MMHANHDASTGALWRQANFWVQFLPIFLTVLLVFAIGLAHLLLLREGGFRLYDEFHTLDRSTSFARHSDWFTVYSMNEPSFRKPPLQYWMSALLLETGIDQIVALRLPSMFFALGGMICVALLSAAVMPTNLWVMPASVLLFASSKHYWEHALSAMLDSGAVFFSTLTLAASLLALKHPRWWYVVGAAIALGSLQKASIGLVLAGLFLVFLSATSPWHGIRVRDIAAQRPFKVSFGVAVVGTVLWPTFQSIVHGTDAFGEFFGDQMIDRFIPGETIGNTRSLRDLVYLIIGGEPYLRWPAILAFFWLPWRLNRMDLLPLPLMFGLFVAAMLLAGGHVTARYTLIFLPILSVALAAVILSLVQRLWIAAPFVALISWVNSGPIKSAANLNLQTSPPFAEQIDALTYVGEGLQPDETLIVCMVSGERRIVPALASYFAANGRSFIRLANNRSFERYSSQGAFSGPLRGICTPEDLRVFANYFVNLTIVSERNGYLIWTASTVR